MRRRSFLGVLLGMAAAPWIGKLEDLLPGYGSEEDLWSMPESLLMQFGASTRIVQDGRYYQATPCARVDRDDHVITWRFQEIRILESFCTDGMKLITPDKKEAAIRRYPSDVVVCNGDTLRLDYSIRRQHVAPLSIGSYQRACAGDDSAWTIGSHSDSGELLVRAPKQTEIEIRRGFLLPTY